MLITRSSFFGSAPLSPPVYVTASTGYESFSGGPSYTANSMTISAANKNVLFALVFYQQVSASNIDISATYGGQAMTKIANYSNGQLGRSVLALTNPPTGTNSIIYTITGDGGGTYTINSIALLYRNVGSIGTVTSYNTFPAACPAVTVPGSGLSLVVGLGQYIYTLLTASSSVINRVNSFGDYPAVGAAEVSSSQTPTYSNIQNPNGSLFVIPLNGSA